MEYTVCFGFLVVISILTVKQVHQVNADVATISARNTDFALALYKQVIAEAGDQENVFMSPISISTAFAMVYAGAKGNTKLQMAKALELHGLTDSVVLSGFKAMLSAFNDKTNNYTLAMANRIYGEKDFNFLDKFLQDTQKNYNATLESVDFRTETEATRKKINAWVERKTNDKIKDLMMPGTVTASTVMVLVNAIYFKGLWTNKFEPKNTMKGPFTLSDNTQVQIDMMNIQEKFKFADSSELGSLMLELPYAGDEVAMYILLPKQNDGLKTVEGKLTRENIEAAINKTAKMSLAVKLPKFKLTQRINLNDFMKALGMKDVFEASKADLSGMSGSKNLKISGATHKAYIDVNEEGTEAAAATGIGVVLTSLPMSFDVNRPFIFMIREKTTGNILFLGRMVKPSSNDGETTLGSLGNTSAGFMCKPATRSLIVSIVALLIVMIRL